MKYLIMYKASVGSLRITEVLARKVDKTFVHLVGGRDRITGGYVRYFRHDEIEEAKEWIISQRRRWSDGDKITKEQINEYKNEEISDKDRAAGKFKKDEKGATTRGVRAGTRRRRTARG